MNIKENFKVERVGYDDCKEWLLYKHYAKRIPSISYAFGLFEDGILKGVCTFGMPASSTLSESLCGEQFKSYVIELNRLVVQSDKKNIASFFISQCFKKIDSPKIIVSFADTENGHTGYIYQACNFHYIGRSEKMKYYRLKNKSENQGGGQYRRRERMAKEEIIKNYGIEFIEEYYSSLKHRYIYFIGSKKEKKEFIKSLKYKIEPYPKGENKRYDASYQPAVQGRLF